MYDSFKNNGFKELNAVHKNYPQVRKIRKKKAKRKFVKLS